jgi:thymidylate kinase
VTLEGIDRAVTLSVAQKAGRLLRSRGVSVVAFEVARPPFISIAVDRHLTALGEAVWNHPPDDPHLAAFDHWVYLHLARYTALASSVVEPLLDTGHTVLVDTWGSTFLAKLSLQSDVDTDYFSALFSRLVQPDVVVHLPLPLQVATDLESTFPVSETGHSDKSVESSVAYRIQLATVLASYAHRNGWQTLDTTHLSVEEIAEAVANSAQCPC